MNLSRAHSIRDLEHMARRFLPKIAFDFIEGGVEDEDCLSDNLEAYRRHKLIPRFLVDVSKRSQATQVFGRTYASPVGIAPTGIAGMWRKGADAMLAGAAAAANVPFVLASASMDAIETIVEIGGKNIWFQSYATRDPSVSNRLIERVRNCGVDTLVVTVDVPVTSKRERNLRNGFSRPLKLRPSIVLEAIQHPAWLIDHYLNGAGRGSLENWAPLLGRKASVDDVFKFYGTQTPSDQQSWEKLAEIRTRWPGRLVVKGMLSPSDASRAFALGADGIILSNHGGRQLDVAPSPLEILPAVRAAVGSLRTVMIDSGIRRGTDVLKAIALGADFAFVGRATLYGVIAAGEAGAARALDILSKEIQTNMGNLGCGSLAELVDRCIPSGTVGPLKDWATAVPSDPKAGLANSDRSRPLAASQAVVNKATE